MTATDNHGPPATILVIDIGGSQVKILATGESDPRTCRSGKRFTPTQMVAAVQALAEGWTYEAISIGYPGVIGALGPRSEAGNLGPGWVGFNFSAAFDRPVRISTMRPCKRWAITKAGVVCLISWRIPAR
jgi:predicted NBD/HSP70 family sugar kinase